MYRHKWGEPSYARGMRSGVYYPRQECEVCGTRRNPFNLRLTNRARGASACWNADVPADAGDLPRQRSRLRADLEVLEEAGETVAWDDGAPDTPALELALSTEEDRT